MNRSKNPHVPMSLQMKAFQALVEKFEPFTGSGKNNVTGKAQLPEYDTPARRMLEARNEALANPRNDERFKNIGTMHPSRAAVFQGTIPAIAGQKQRKKK